MTRPPKKELPSFPKISASSRLPDLSANYKARRGDDAASCSQPARGSIMPDGIFYNVVPDIMEGVAGNTSKYHQEPTYKRVNVIAQVMLDMHNNVDNYVTVFSATLLGELTRYVGTLLTLIWKSMRWSTKR